MKRTYVVILCLLFTLCTTLIEAQQYASYASTLRRTDKYYDCHLLEIYYGGQDLDNTGIAFIGRVDNNITNDCNISGNRSRESFRMAYKWDVSAIPDDATIKSASLEIWYTSASDNYTNVVFTMRKLSLSDFNVANQARWTAIGSGTTYATQTVSLSGSEQYVSVNLNASTADIKSSLTNGDYFIVGVKTEDDETWTAQSGIYRYVQPKRSVYTTEGMKLTISYSIPVNVTVQNGFTGNGGSVTVDGNPWPSPKTFTSWQSGEAHTLFSTQQTVGNKRYTPQSPYWKNTGTGETFSINPVTITIPVVTTTFEAQFGPPETQVTVQQKKSSGSLTTNGLGRWNGTSFESYTNPSYPWYPEQQTQVLRGYQEIESGEKYNQWFKDASAEADVLNHHVFPFGSSFPGTVTSQFKGTNNSTLSTALLEGSGSVTTLEFKDPWLIDSADGSYGGNLRNRGMLAPLKSVTVATSNLGTATAHKGMFLNQGGPASIT